MRLNPFARDLGPRADISAAAAAAGGGGVDDELDASAPEDYGFGDKVAGRGVRLLGKDGKFNVERRGGARARFAYQLLIEMPWWQFFAAVLAYYVAINGALALGFFALGPAGIAGIPVAAPWYERLAGCFFFSVQTFTTVGYGSMAPVTLAQQLLAGFGALVGLMSLALATGLFFARFSRPRRTVAFSERAVVAPYEDHAAFQFRVASRSSSKLINVRAQVVYSWVAPAGDGELRRRFYTLPLERDHIAMFPLNWTIVHPIAGDSPLADCDPAALARDDGEFVVQVSGYDETYARQVYAHTSYRATCIDFGRRFAPMYEAGDDGMLVLHLDRIDDTEPAALPGRGDGARGDGARSTIKPPAAGDVAPA